jgi:hypothetical protein
MQSNMKKSISTTNSIILTLALCLITYGANSQELKSKKKSMKEADKVERETNFKELGSALEKKRFLVEMEYQLDRNQNKMNLNPMQNFISVDSSNCVLQSESDNLLVTLKKYVSKVEGRTENWKLKKNEKNLSYYIQFIMATYDGPYRVYMTVNSDKTASGNLTSPYINFSFYGKLAIQ